MSEEMEDIVDHLKEPSAWIRILFMLAFATVLYIVIAPLIFVLMLAQALFSVFTGDSNQNLRYLGNALCTYVNQILEFITYNSEQKPFPFSDFPAPGRNDASAAPKQANGAKPKSATAKKRPARKKVASKKPDTGDSADS